MLGIGLIVILSYLVIGVVIGWLAGLLMKGKGFGCLGNVAIALLGSLLGGFIFRGVFNIKMGSILTAFLGAILLLFIVNLFSKK
jgi:uncharacterized membrane protein YeaQ/YmgE (transglycosylase-associated protein family)